MFLDIATVVGFLVITVVAFLLLNAMFSGRRAAVMSSAGDEAALLASTPRKAGFFKRSLAYAIYQPKSALESLRADLLKAGYYRPTAVEDYLASRNAGVVTILILFGSLAVLVEPGSRLAPTLLIVGLVVALFAYALPRLALARQANARVRRIEQGLPDALDLMQMCLAGGLAFRDSLKRVAEEIRHVHPDIAVELDIVRRQANAGTVSQALRNFADRIDAPDIKALSLTVIQNERLGTSIAVAVSEFADQMRLSYRQRAEERAGKVGIWILFPVILCLIPPVLIAIAGPPLVKLRNFLRDENRPGGVLNPPSASEIQGGQNGAGNQGGQ